MFTEIPIIKYNIKFQYESGNIKASKHQAQFSSDAIKGKNNQINIKLLRVQ